MMVSNSKIERLRKAQELLSMTKEEFVNRVNPYYSFDDEEEWNDFRDYENGTKEIPFYIFGRVFLLALRKNIGITLKWLLSED